METLPMATEWDDSRLADVGGRRLAFREKGQGRPTVVLETGFGATGNSFDGIAKRIAEFIRVVWYDHAGLGRSDPAPRPRTVADPPLDLQALLHTAQIPPPYLLVGHSLGALTVRYYQQRYPTDVVALVLIWDLRPMHHGTEGPNYHLGESRPHSRFSRPSLLAQVMAWNRAAKPPDQGRSARIPWSQGTVGMLAARLASLAPADYAWRRNRPGYRGRIL